MMKELTAALRDVLLAAANAAKEDQAQALGALEASVDWLQLDEAERAPILQASGLIATSIPVVASDEELLAALDATPLSAWAERRQAIPAKVAAARATAARKHEPKSVAVVAPAATLRTQADVDAYLSALRALLLQHIDDHATIII